MKLKDIYRPDTVTIDVDDDLAAAARREAGKLVGIFTERDLVGATARAANPADVLVSAHTLFRPETADVEEDSRDVARGMAAAGGGSMRDLPAVEAWM